MTGLQCGSVVTGVRTDAAGKVTGAETPAALPVLEHDRPQRRQQPHQGRGVHRLDEVVGLVGRAAAAVHWPGAHDAAPVHTVCLLVTPAARPGDCLRILEDVARQLRGG